MGHALGNNYGKVYAFQSKPVILDLQFQVTSTNGLGVTNVKGQGVSSVYMHSSSPSAANPNPASGIAWIHLAYSYSRMYALSWDIVSPVTGSDLAINATAMTANTAYQITAVGAGPTGTVTVATVADTAGSLASKYFLLFDGYGNTFVIWFSVAGVGSAPAGVAGTPVQISIASGATAAQVGTAIATAVNGLSAQTLLNPYAPAVAAFTATGTTTVTIVSTKTGQVLPGVPQDGVSPLASGFTFAITKYGTNQGAWQAVGLPAGVSPAVGCSFISRNTGYATGGGSTGTVKAIGNSGIQTLEVMGDANLELFPQPYLGSPNVGGWVMVQFLAATSSSVTTLIPTAPTDTSIVKMSLLLEQATRVGGNNE